MNTEVPDDIIEVINDYKDIQYMSNKWKGCMGEYPFSVPIFKKAERMVESNIKRIEEKYNDQQKWISWFIFDANCGKDSPIIRDESGIEVVIDTVKKLWAIIEKWYAGDIRENENDNPPVDCGFNRSCCGADCKTGANSQD